MTDDGTRALYPRTARIILCLCLVFVRNYYLWCVSSVVRARATDYTRAQTIFYKNRSIAAATATGVTARERRGAVVPVKTGSGNRWRRRRRRPYALRPAVVVAAAAAVSVRAAGRPTFSNRQRASAVGPVSLVSLFGCDVPHAVCPRAHHHRGTPFRQSILVCSICFCFSRFSFDRGVRSKFAFRLFFPLLQTPFVTRVRNTQ